MLAPAIALALTHALTHGEGDGLGCSARELQAIVQRADVTRLGTLNGARVVLASVSGSCLCGNVNCPYLVLRLDLRGERVLLDTSAFALAPAGKQRPLPDLHESAHDSALVSIETTYAYRNGAYAAVRSEQLRGDNGESKPVVTPVRFAPGASSATVSGRVSLGWDDAFSFDAKPGQRITVSGPASFGYSVEPQNGSVSRELVPGKAVLLPPGAPYTLVVRSDNDTERSYRATIAIR